MPLSHPKDVTMQSNRVHRKVLKSFVFHSEYMELIRYLPDMIIFRPESKPPAKKSNKNKTKVEAANLSMNNQEEKNVSDADGDLEDKKHI